MWGAGKSQNWVRPWVSAQGRESFQTLCSMSENVQELPKGPDHPRTRTGHHPDFTLVLALRRWTQQAFHPQIPSQEVGEMSRPMPALCYLIFATIL